MNLPETWRLVRLSTVCEINPPLFGDERPSPDTSVSFVPMAAVDEVEGKITRPETRALREVSKGFTPFREKDVLFAKITPSMENGKAAIGTGLENGLGFGSTEFHVLRPSEHLLPDYLFYFIRQSWFRERARAAFFGSAGQQRVPQDFLERVLFPLPPLPEQHRIVAILRQAGELRRLRRKTNEDLSTMRQRLFNAAFPNFGKAEKTISLGSICSFITSGSRDWSRYYSSEEDVPKFIRVQNIKLGMIDLSDIAHVKPPTGPEADRARIQPGDIVISITGTVGQAALVTPEIGECYVSQHVALVRTDGSIPTRFLVEYINHPTAGQQQINRVNYGQVKPGLNLKQIQDLRIPVFDQAQMNFFTAGLDEIVSLELTAQESAREINLLFQEIIAQAFNGSISAVWRASHRRELEAAARTRDAALGRATGEAIRPKIAPTEPLWFSQPERYWLMNQLSKEQGSVWEALRTWHGTLIPAEDLDEFRVQCFSNGSLENTNDSIFRALDQLAGLGLIAKISVPNQQGEYVTGYRGLREDELSHIADRQSLAES